MFDGDGDGEYKKSTEYGSVVYARHGTGAMEHWRTRDGAMRWSAMDPYSVVVSRAAVDGEVLSSFLKSGEWDV